MHPFFVCEIMDFGGIKSISTILAYGVLSTLDGILHMHGLSVQLLLRLSA